MQGQVGFSVLYLLRRALEDALDENASPRGTEAWPKLSSASTSAEGGSGPGHAGNDALASVVTHIQVETEWSAQVKTARSWKFSHATHDIAFGLLLSWAASEPAKSTSSSDASGLLPCPLTIRRTTVWDRLLCSCS